LPTFYGTVATPVKYQAQDTLGQFENSTITPTVAEPPTATQQMTFPVEITTRIKLSSHLKTIVLASNEQTLLPETLKLCQVDNPATTGTNEAQSPNNCTATSVTIPGEGTYTVNSDGTVTFNPLPTFTGTVANPSRIPGNGRFRIEKFLQT
jgi:CshA-type fibril repeat protein